MTTKKMILVLIPVLMAASLFAYDFKWDGMFRTRAAAYNDDMGTPGAHIDNRLQLGLKSELVPGLTLRAKFEIGQNGADANLVWGGNGGGIATNGINVKTNEAYIDYRIEAIKANVRVGQQYWADHRSLILDDTFSGVTFHTSTPDGISGMLGFGKYAEGNYHNRYDDMQGIIFSLDTAKPVEAGLQGYLTWSRVRPIATEDAIQLNYISVMPYASMNIDPITVDGVLFVQSNDSFSFVGGYLENESDLSFGVALKAGVDVQPLEVNADILYISENGLMTLSGYYQNGLYLLGIGEHHDGLGLWWGATGNPDMYLGAALQAKFEAMKGVKVFGAGGMVLDTGLELNGGLEVELVPNLLHLAAFAAYSIMDEDVSDQDNYALGTTIKLAFD
jgi:hypothetical protein